MSLLSATDTTPPEPASGYYRFDFENKNNDESTVVSSWSDGRTGNLYGTKGSGWTYNPNGGESGTGSYTFDGSDGYLAAPNLPDSTLQGDYTIMLKLKSLDGWGSNSRGLFRSTNDWHPGTWIDGSSMRPHDDDNGYHDWFGISNYTTQNVWRVYGQHVRNSTILPVFDDFLGTQDSQNSNSYTWSDTIHYAAGPAGSDHANYEVETIALYTKGLTDQEIDNFYNTGYINPDE